MNTSSPRTSNFAQSACTWLRTSALGGAMLVCSAVFAATPIPAGPLVSTEWLAQNLDNKPGAHCGGEREPGPV